MKRTLLPPAGRVCVPPGQVLVLVEVLEEGRLTDELLLLTHLLAGASRLGQPDLQGAEGGPHHLTVAEVLTRRKKNKRKRSKSNSFYNDI